jgi:hypothetical protein
MWVNFHTPLCDIHRNKGAKWEAGGEGKGPLPSVTKKESTSVWKELLLCSLEIRGFLDNMGAPLVNSDCSKSDLEGSSGHPCSPLDQHFTMGKSNMGRCTAGSHLS